MISHEEASNRDASSFPGGTDITSIVDSLYSSLYQFAVGLTKGESDAADLVQQTFLTTCMKSWSENFLLAIAHLALLLACHRRVNRSAPIALLRKTVSHLGYFSGASLHDASLC